MADAITYKFLATTAANHWTAIGGSTMSIQHYVGIANNNAATLQTQLNTMYKGTSLEGLVTGVGAFSWQKFICPANGVMTATVRGGAGGVASAKAVTINANTGVASDSKSSPGRGAKVVGSFAVHKEDILYISVGFRGYTSNGSSSWGAGGGGASTILRVNPNGAYTFALTNEKVDVLMVAGGGGGCASTTYTGNTAWKGGDASPNDGTSTLGGVVTGTVVSNNFSAGGGGLTGDGQGNGNVSGTPNGKETYAILKGTINLNGGTTSKPCWGSGGAGQVAGGGGGGYSGGNSTSRMGGYGGSSYMNPTYVTAISRGYATVAEDSTRDLVNPWTAYGNIEISFKANSNMIFIEDSEGIKYFNGTVDRDNNPNPDGTDTWELLPDDVVLGEEAFLEYAKYIPTNKTGLLDEEAKILCMSEDEEASISIDGKINKAIVKQTIDTIVSDIGLITAVAATFNSLNADIQFAISKNSGKTWQSYNGIDFVDIDTEDRDIFAANGYNLSLITSIPLETWNNYKAKTIRFAFCVTQKSNTTAPIITSVDFTGNLIGSWRKALETEATYEYTAIDNLRIHLTKAGNYKVNYLDSLGS